MKSTPEKIELKCPVKPCSFYIKVSKDTEWNKVYKAFCQHLMENHTPLDLAEMIYNFVVAEARDKNPSFLG